MMRQILCLTGLLLLTGCGGSGGESDPGTALTPTPLPSDDFSQSEETDPEPEVVDCGIPAQNQWVDDNMRDFYLFYDQVPVVNLQDYDSPAALIRDLRVQPFDQFSNVRDIVVNESSLGNGREVWFGYSWRRHSDGTARIAYVYDDSPMGRAGVRRADQIVSLNGAPWGQLGDEQFDALIGTAESPNTVRWVFARDSDNTTYTIDVAMAEYSINAVLAARTFEHPDYDGVIGYLAYRSFLDSSAAELDTVMQEFRSRNVTDLVLDLRYNGGGRVRMARKLTSQIAGPATDGQVFAQYMFNDNYQDRNFDLLFEAEPLNLGMNRLVVLVTSETAAASEMVINSLRPYVPVTVFGESATEGNPYISYGTDLEACGIRMNILEAENVNASRASVVGGLLPDCAASDDLTAELGDNNENMLARAMDFFVLGTCDAPDLLASRKSADADASVKQLPAGGGAIAE